MNSNSYCIITLNENTGRMHINSTMSYNTMIRGFPNVRFEKRRSIWVAPIIRRNAEHLVYRLSKVAGVSIEPRVMDLCLAAIDNVAAKRAELFPIGYQFKTTPFPHQKDALDFGWSIDLVAYFMEMGTGKTKTLIDLACARFKAGLINSLVVYCPVPLRSNWIAELHTHCSVPYAGFVVDTKKSSFKKESQRFFDLKDDRIMKVVVVGIESFSQGLKKGKAYEFLDRYVRAHNSQQAVDESHKIKGYDATRAENIVLLGREDRYKAILTGSPVVLGLTDLYMQFEYLSKDIIGLGDFMSFRNRYCEMGGFQNKQMLGFKNEEELMEIIKPFVFQVKKEDVLKDLPPKVFTKFEAEMTDEQCKVYLEVKKTKTADLSMLVAKKGTMNKEDFVELVCDNVLAAYLALQQITAGFVTYWKVDEETGRTRETVEIVPPEQNPKIRLLVDWIDDNPGQPMIIWARFRKEIADIVQVLEAKYGAGCAVQYHGGMNMDERDAAKKAFLDGGPTFFVSNQMTGGTGLTLNRADRVWYQSNTFALVDRMQSEDRNHRIGQTKQVIYADCEMVGTVDGTINLSMAMKMDVANYVRSCMERSPDDLMKLLADV